MSESCTPGQVLEAYHWKNATSNHPTLQGPPPNNYHTKPYGIEAGYDYMAAGAAQTRAQLNTTIGNLLRKSAKESVERSIERLRKLNSDFVTLHDTLATLVHVSILSGPIVKIVFDNMIDYIEKLEEGEEKDLANQYLKSVHTSLSWDNL